MMKQGSEEIKKALLKKGVDISSPESVEIGPEVNPDRISGHGVKIYAGCRIFGARTLLLSGVELGYEGPVTVKDCLLGRNVRLGGGYFESSCFLEGASMGSGGQVRAGCLLEEGARGAHTVGLKQTILFPFVTLGSLINFCDCLMAGGTDAKNHSEVGSSYIHFNYTPNQDKATASLIGDVPGGVMLNRPPIFLGGQGGLVGPVTIGYGVTVAAGTIVRKDLLKENSIILGQRVPPRAIPFHQGLYTNIQRLIALNTRYIANLIVLRRWYLDIRARFMDRGAKEKALLEGAVEVITGAVNERLRRFSEVAGRMPRSIALYESVSKKTNDLVIRRKQEFATRWPRLNDLFSSALEEGGDGHPKEAFLDAVDQSAAKQGAQYLDVIKGLQEKGTGLGTGWLQGMVDSILKRVWEALPSFQNPVSGGP
jgi:UDP-N-acetylglucosamine/UDP-N-acetylgalactosamine diphosphorylase